MFDRLVDFDSPYSVEIAKANGQAVPANKEEAIVTRVISTGPSIVFAEGISLPTLPTGFVIDDPAQIKRWRISRGEGVVVDTSDTFKALRDILEAMERLYEWALSLPDFKNE